MPLDIPPLSPSDLNNLIGLSRSPLDGMPLGVQAEAAPSAGEMTYNAAMNHELRAEVERLRGERDRMADVQNRIMELLGTRSPDRILHDLRNVLNERELYKALADTIED